MSTWETLGKSDDWYTPPEIFDALGCEFDLDVAAPKAGPPYVPCKHWFYHSALSRPWLPGAFVWMNPPFGGRNALEPWLEKFFEHGNGIALTPDRTSAPWFLKWAPLAMSLLFLPRVKFIRPDGEVGRRNSTGTAVWAAGPTAHAALRRAAGAGLGLHVIPVAR